MSNVKDVISNVVYIYMGIARRVDCQLTDGSISTSRDGSDLVAHVTDERLTGSHRLLIKTGSYPIYVY